MRKFLLTAIVALIMGAAIVPAHATLVTYSTQIAFTGAAASRPTTR